MNNGPFNINRRADVTPEMFNGDVQKAVNAAAEFGVFRVRLSDNTTYDMSSTPSLIIPPGVKLRGSKSSVIDFTGITGYGTRDNPLISAKGTIEADTDITAFVAHNANTIPVTDASGIQAGDLIEIWEQILNPSGDDGWYDTSVGVHLGELHWVQSVSGNTITIQDRIYEKQGYSTAREFVAKVRKVNYVSDILLEGFTVKGKGRPATGSGDVGIYFKYGVDVHVKNVQSIDVDKLACSFVGCIEWSCEDSTFRHPIKAVNDDTNYSIVPTSSSRSGKVKGNFVYNSRHGVVTSHISVAASEFVPGVSRFIEVASNEIHSTWHAGISTHSDAEHYKIHDNQTFGCGFAGFDIRERNMEVYDNTAYTQGAVGAGFIFRKNPSGLIAKNNKSDGTFRLIELDSFRTTKNITIDGVDYSDNTTPQSAAFQVSADTGALRGLRVSKVNVSNFTGNGGAAAAIRVEGDISKGYCKNFTVDGASSASGVRLTAKNFALTDGEVYNVGVTGVVFAGLTLGDNIQYSRVTTGGYTTRQSGVSNVDFMLDNIDLGATTII